MEVSDQIHALAALHLEESPTYPFYRLDVTHSRSGRGSENKSLPLPGIEHQ
jgi:hypothetical protein